MTTETIGSILAIVTTDNSLVTGGGAPVFLARSPEEQQKVGLYISHTLNAMVHDAGNGVLIIVRH
jgi:hypothetical protein